MKTIKYSKDFHLTCGICGYEYTNASYRNTVAAHIASHSGYKEFECTNDRCTDRFANYGNLEGHLRNHCQGKPKEKDTKAECGWKECNEEFEVDSKLYLEHLIGHFDTDTDLNTCGVCGVVFKDNKRAS